MSTKKNFNYKDYLIHGVFLTLYGLVKYVPSPLGDIFRYVVIKFFIRSMGRVRIYEGVTLWFPYNIEIGTNVSLNEWVYISAYAPIKISDNVRIGHRTSIISSNHSTDRIDIPICEQPLTSAAVEIEADVWIGCNVTILAGVTIGKGAVIGAGAVVTRNVPPYAVVVGIPARIIRQRTS